MDNSLFGGEEWMGQDIAKSIAHTRQCTDERWRKEYDTIKVLRPDFADHGKDENGMPVIHRMAEDMIDIDNAMPLNIQNIGKCSDIERRIVLAFRFDNRLAQYWNDPLAHILELRRAMAVCTPDFSAYPNMNRIELEHNIYKNRWLGCLWQNYGCAIIPTITWAGRDADDLCFSGIERGGIVAISTMGCCRNVNAFLVGYNVMIRKLMPQLVIVFGNIIDGMAGRIVNYRYDESLGGKWQRGQIRLFNAPVIVHGTKDVA